MTKLTAKSIVNGTSWVITDGNTKVGNVTANTNGYEVSVNGSWYRFSSTDEIKQKLPINFKDTHIPATKMNNPYPEFPVDGTASNSMIDVQRKLHLFTKSADSKCFYVAGWFVVQFETPEVILCPKYLYIQRYKYLGPFKTEQEAVSELKTIY